MNSRHITFILILSASATTFSYVPANAQSAAQPDELQAVYACKTIAQADERLACYDRTVGRFEEAEKSGEVVTVSKTAIEKVEKDAFGFNIPSLPSLGRIFSGKKSDKDTPKENPLTAPVKPAPVEPAPVEPAPVKEASRSEIPSEPTPAPAVKPKLVPSKITEVTLNIQKTTEFAYKKTRFFMSNGQVWEQTDTKKVRVPKVRNGNQNTAEISKALLGSYFLRVNGNGSAVRVKRVR